MDASFPDLCDETRKAGTPGEIRFGVEYQASIEHLLHRLDALPESALPLHPSDYNELGLAVTYVKAAWRKWERGEVTHRLRPDTRSGRENPLTTVRRILAGTPDERQPDDPERFRFIDDLEVRSLLATEYAAVETALSNHEWKATTVLAGALVEALLLFALSPVRQEGSGQLDSPHNFESLSLGDLTELAEKARLIKQSTAAQCRLAKDFRNLIHPGRVRRLGQRCTRGTAHAAFAAVNEVVEDLSAR
jgi:hypothetical protein